MAGDSIRSGRLARGLPLAGLAARQGIGRVAGKLTRDEQKQLDRFTREAERYVAVLGDMKGVAMKVGQLVSFLDAGAIPEQHRAAYRQIVGALQADAPPMPFETVLDVLAHELGRPADAAFAWIGERNFDAFGEWRDIARGMGIGPESKDWTFLTRIQLGLYSVLGALRSTCDWRAVHDELRKGDPPQTDLGRRHHTWKPARIHRSGDDPDVSSGPP